MQNAGTLSKDQMAGVNSALDKVFDAVEDDEKYRPQTFMASLREFQQSVP